MKTQSKYDQVIEALKQSKRVTSRGRDLALFNDYVVTVIRTGRGKAFTHTSNEAIEDAIITNK